MTLRVQVSARAAGQVRKAAGRWAEHRPAAPGAIGQDRGEAVTLLSQFPGIGHKYEGTRVPGVRRLYLNRVGYHHYHEVGHDSPRVLAFSHASRESRPRR